MKPRVAERENFSDKQGFRAIKDDIHLTSSRANGANQKTSKAS